MTSFTLNAASSGQTGHAVLYGAAALVGYGFGADYARRALRRARKSRALS